MCACVDRPAQVAWNNDETKLHGLDEDIRKRQLGDGAGVATLPLHQVFLTHVEVCSWVVDWASNASETARADLLTLLPRVAFEKHTGGSQGGEEMPMAAGGGDVRRRSSTKLTAASSRHLSREGRSSREARISREVSRGEKWELVRSEPPMAQLTTRKEHTTHPYASAAETLEVHRIDGAEAIELFFDRRTSTEESHDFVRVYSGDKFMNLALEHSGGTTALWPGTSGVPPVVIPGDCFGVAFKSDASDTSWGWELTARARVPTAKVELLQEKLAAAFPTSGSDDEMPTDHVLEAALADKLLSVQNAYDLLTDPILGKKFRRDNAQVYTPGYYQKGEGGVRINLQCAEVYLCTQGGSTRMQMPAPPLVAENADFRHVFAGAQKYVVEVGRTTRCQELQLSHEGIVYRVAAWKPLSPSLAGGAAVVSYAQKPLTTYHKALRVEQSLREYLELGMSAALPGSLGPEPFGTIEKALDKNKGDEDRARDQLIRQINTAKQAQQQEKLNRATHVPGEEPEAVAALQELAAWGMPVLHGASQLNFQGRLYMRYVCPSRPAARKISRMHAQGCPPASSHACPG